MGQHQKHIDEVTGVETTAHVWDGDLRELNKPLPRWWLLTFYACIVWAVGYMIAYPAWPLVSDYTKGMLGYSQRAEVMKEVAAGKAAQAKFIKGVADTPLKELPKNKELMQFALTGGAAAFGDNCSGCHGRGAQGGPGYPNLNDDDWIWGGSLEQIEKTIKFGIRSGHKSAHESAMPRFGVDKLLEPAQVSQVASYVLTLAGKEADKKAADAGGAIFKEQCASCHGEAGKGNQELGAPNLTDAIWLYGAGKDQIATSIETGRGGVMPLWEGRLDPVTIKMLTVYVHSLGGGK